MNAQSYAKGNISHFIIGEIMSLDSVIPQEALERILDVWKRKGAEYAECRAELRKFLRVEFRNKEIKVLDSGISAGVAIRAIVDGKVHFTIVAAGELALEKIDKERVISDKPWIRRVKLKSTEPVRDEVIIKEKKSLEDMPVDEKISFVKEMHNKCFADIVKSVLTRYSEEIVEKRIITSEGTNVYMKIPYVYIRHEVTAEEKGRLNSARGVWGAIGGFEVMEYEKVVDMTNQVRKSACEGARAERCPSGKFRVLLDGDLNHLLAHEALGHAAEADIVRVGSILKGKLGKKVASDFVNVVDDGRFELNGVKGFGWIPYDDEGVPTERTLIIKEGILNTYMTDRITASEFNLELTGNARAQDWTLPPAVRMRNTFIEPVSSDIGMKREELLQELRNGLLLRHGRGGQVDTTRGVFTFGVQEAYLIRNGEIVKRLSSTSISGNILVVLKNIEAVGRDFDPPQLSAGYCGKVGLVPVGVSGPWILVKEIIVGG